jgi:hypothetical protein
MILWIREARPEGRHSLPVHPVLSDFDRSILLGRARQEERNVLTCSGARYTQIGSGACLAMLGLRRQSTRNEGRLL